MIALLALHTLLFAAFAFLPFSLVTFLFQALFLLAFALQPLLFPALLLLAFPRKPLAFKALAFGLVSSMALGFHPPGPLLFIAFMFGRGLTAVILIIRLIVVAGLIMEHYTAVNGERQHYQQHQYDMHRISNCRVPFHHEGSVIWRKAR